MGVHEGRGMLNKAMKELMSRWNEATASWDDVKSKEFEEKHLTPLTMDLKMAMSETTKAAWANPNDRPMEDYNKK